MSIKTLERKITPTVKKLVEEYWLLDKSDKILIVSDYPTSTDFVDKQISLLSDMIERNLLARSIKKLLSQIFLTLLKSILLNLHISIMLILMTQY